MRKPAYTWKNALVGIFVIPIKFLLVIFLYIIAIIGMGASVMIDIVNDVFPALDEEVI